MDKKFIRELCEIMNDIGVDELTFKNSEALITFKKYSKIGQLLEANQLLSPQSTAVRGLREGISAEGEGQDLNAQHAEDAGCEMEGNQKFESITANTIGTYYSKPDPDSEAFVREGDRVKKGQVICILEAMKMMNEIKAPFNCKIEKILISDGEVVEFGEELFKVSKS